MSQFERRGQAGAHIRDVPAGVYYDVIAGARNLGGDPLLTYLAVEVADGVRLDQVKQLGHPQLALIAAEVAAQVQANRERDAEHNARIAEQITAGTYRSDTVGVGSFLLADPYDRGGPVTPRPEWIAYMVKRCRKTGAPSHSTIAALIGKTETTAKRHVREAVRLGLLDGAGRGRPQKPITPKESA